MRGKKIKISRKNKGKQKTYNNNVFSLNEKDLKKILNHKYKADVTIDDKKFNKLLNNNFKSEVTIIDDGKKEFKGVRSLICVFVIFILSLIMPLFLNLTTFITNGWNNFVEVYLNCFKEYVYSSLLISVVGLIIFIAYSKKI